MSDSVEQRLRALEDERDILKRLYAYGHTIDYGDEEGFMDLFTDDASLAYNWDAANMLADTGMPADRRLEGREAIQGFIRGHTNAPDVYHKHMLMEPQIEVEGDRATAVTYFSRFDRSENGPMVSSFGRYRDVFVRCDDGRWRFRERRAEIEGRVPGAISSVR